MKKRKDLALFFLFLVLGMMWGGTFTYIYSQDQEWKPPGLKTLEEKFLDLSARISTLDAYAPDKYPDFQELEKINQLVEMLDFNRREFELLIQQYNIVEDELFPFSRKFSAQHPGLKESLYKTLTEYTGKEEKSLLHLQERINTVALQVERLEKRIEKLQILARDKEIAEETSQKSDPGKQPADISARLLQLEEDRKNYTDRLVEEEKKLTRLMEKEKVEAAKVEEKKNEAAEMRQKAAASKDKIESLILQTFSRVREIRLNGLEIPRLNTTRTFIYLANTTIDTLKTQIQNTDKSIRALKVQRKEELIDKLVKSAAVAAAALLMIFNK